MKTLILAIIFSAGLSGGVARSAYGSVVIDRLEAVVNSSLVTYADIIQYKKTLDLRAQLDPLFNSSPLSEKGVNAPKHEIVDFLVNEKLITLQFPVVDAEVEQEIKAIQTANHVDRAALSNALKAQGFDFKDYFELIRVGISKKQLIDRDIRTKVYISDDDIKNYFYNHYHQEDKSELSYQIKIITVTPSQYKTPDAAKTMVQKVYTLLKNGESFDEVARLYSDDPSSAQGGTLGTFKESEISADIKNEVKKLAVGAISGILGTEKTKYFILSLGDLQSSDSDLYAQKKEEIRNYLLTQEFQKQLVLWVERQKQTAFVRHAGDRPFGLENVQPAKK